MEILYKTDDGKVFDSVEELRTYESKPWVYILRLHHRSWQEQIFDRDAIIGVFLTKESATVAKEQFYNSKSNEAQYGARRYQNRELIIEQQEVESCFGRNTETVSEKLWEKFKSIFK